MDISEEDFNFLIDRIINMSDQLEQTDIERHNLLGVLGEKLVGFSICYVMWRLDYMVSFNNHPRSYTIIPNFKPEDRRRDGIRGMDYYLRVVNSNEEIVKIFVEVKNWGGIIVLLMQCLIQKSFKDILM